MATDPATTELPVVPRTPTGLDPATGAQLYNYDLSALDDWAEAHGYNADNPIPIAATGPHSAGLVKLADGTLYDVTDHFIICHSNEHAQEIHHHIALQHERSGRFDDPVTGTKFRHTDCAHCDAPQTEHLKDARLRTAVAAGHDTVLQPVPVEEAVKAHLKSLQKENS